MRIAVIPATYNRPDMLAALFEGYLAQDYKDFEIIIADDGSGEATREVVKHYQQRAPFRIAHAWQENQGYRAGTIRNKAVAQSKADYLIFTDQDCVPRPDFLSNHQRIAERGWFVAGNRVLLSEGFTNHILTSSDFIHDKSLTQWIYAWMHRDINRIQPLLELPDGPWRKLHPKRWRGAKTCNLGVWRDDYVAVNGMDESYSGWGLEDSDLVIRLIRAGIEHKSGRYACPVFHLWHRESSRSSLEENRLRLDQVLTSAYTRAIKGMDQY